MLLLGCREFSQETMIPAGMRSRRGAGTSSRDSHAMGDGQRAQPSLGGIPQAQVCHAVCGTNRYIMS